jgi:hypothetical protein
VLDCGIDVSPCCRYQRIPLEKLKFDKSRQVCQENAQQPFTLFISEGASNGGRKTDDVVHDVDVRESVFGTGNAAI